MAFEPLPSQYFISPISIIAPLPLKFSMRRGLGTLHYFSLDISKLLNICNLYSDIETQLLIKLHRLHLLIISLAKLGLRLNLFSSSLISFAK